MAMYIIPRRRNTPFFDDFMDIDFDPWCTSFYQPLQYRCCRRKPCTWSKQTNIMGFKPEEISLSKDNNKVSVLAKQIDGENYTEMKQVFQIPDDVDVGSVKFVIKEGTMYLIGDYIPKERTVPVNTVSNQTNDTAAAERRVSVETSQNGEKEIMPQENVCNFTYTVPGYKPEQIDVRLMDNNKLSISGENKEEGDGHFYQEKFSRIIQLPNGVDFDKIKCDLDNEGKLRITAPNDSN